MTQTIATTPDHVPASLRLAQALRNGRAEARLTYSFARRALHSQYRQSALTVLWSVMQPIALVAIYAIVFSQILRVEGDDLPYLSFVVAGLVVWRYFSTGLMMATSFIDRSDTLVKASFRREVIPLSGCGAALVDLCTGMVALFAVAAIQGIKPTITVLAVPMVLVVLLFYTATVAVLMATVTVFVRDLAHALPTISQVLFLASPILYPTSQIPPALDFMGTVNPVAVAAEAMRRSTLAGEWPSFPLLSLHLVVGAGLLVASIAYLRSIEHRIVDVV